jgi:hypothetical protein
VIALLAQHRPAGAPAPALGQRRAHPSFMHLLDILQALNRVEARLLIDATMTVPAEQDQIGVIILLQCCLCRSGTRPSFAAATWAISPMTTSGS